VIYKDGSQLSDEGYRQILVDKHTGVNYLPYLSHLFGQIMKVYENMVFTGFYVPICMKGLAI